MAQPFHRPNLTGTRGGKDQFKWNGAVFWIFAFILPLKIFKHY
jgi:hypothetical protein